MKYYIKYIQLLLIYIQSIMSKTESHLHYYPSGNHKNFEHQETLSCGIVFPAPFYLLPPSQVFPSFPLQTLTVMFEKEDELSIASYMYADCSQL